MKIQELKVSWAARIVMIIFVTVSISIPFLYPFFMGTIAQRSELIEYNGSDGFYDVVRDADGKTRLGNHISEGHPGESFGWKTSWCLKTGVTGLIVMQLILTTGHEREILLMEFPITSANRCGARDVVRAFPLDTPPGYYEIRRSLLLRTIDREPVTVPLPSLFIEVTNVKRN